jgi:hypothetical protein
VTGEGARALVGGVEHHAVEARIGAAADEIEIRPPIGKADGDETDAVARRRGQRRQRRRRVAREDTEFDDVDAGRGHGADRGEDRRRRERLIADRRTRRPPPGDRRQHGAHDLVGEPPQGARLRLLEIDDVGAAGDGDERLRGRANACQKLGHGAPPCCAAA